jgi:predicted nucleic acid-binding protein
MKPLSCLSEAQGVLIADTSVAINLNATGCAGQVLRALPYKTVIVDIIQEELELGRNRGRRDAELTAALVASKHIDVVALGEVGLGHFEQLVVGPGAETLDDGEAATLACALELGGIPIIDEHKAVRLCSSNFAGLAVASSLDLLGHAHVCKALGWNRLAEAVFLALRDARMRVFERHLDWVVELIGRDRAVECPSLPRKVRVVEARHR